VATTGPTPGKAARRRQASLPRQIATTSASSLATRASTSRSWSKSSATSRRGEFRQPGLGHRPGRLLAEAVRPRRQHDAVLGEQAAGVVDQRGALDDQPLAQARWAAAGDVPTEACAAPSAGMGLAPSGGIRQQINEAVERLGDWDPDARSRCFVHIADSLAWRAVTGEAPPVPPPTAADYARAGLPWFAWYDDRPALEGSSVLAGLASVRAMGERRGEAPLPENEEFEPPEPVALRPRRRARGVPSDF
jgi:hypothetical protein